MCEKHPRLETPRSLIAFFILLALSRRMAWTFNNNNNNNNNNIINNNVIIIIKINQSILSLKQEKKERNNGEINHF
jgi:hypothetical protein